MLYILLSIAVLFILAQAWLLYKFVNRITELTDQRDKALVDYQALDQGFSELTDAYETDSLQYEDTIANLHEQAEIDRIARHEQARTIDDYRSRLETAREAHQSTIEENLEIRRRLDMAQVIILEHDQNCLPHVVLSHMEQTETIPGL